MAKKYLSLERLAEYDELIKNTIDAGDESVKSYVDTEVAKKANSSHTHDDRYYTETEIDSKISGVNSTISSHTGNSDIHVTTANKSNWNSAYTHSTSAHAPSNAEKNVIVGIQKNGTDLTVNSSTRKVNITVPTTAADIGAASSTHNHDDKYDAKGAADTALSSAKTYADTAASNAANEVKDDLLNGAGTAYDTLKELGDLIDDNQDAIAALETVASGKADATHTHTISDVTNLQTTLNAKATQTSLDSHTSNTTAHITSTERTNWNAAKTHADSAHAPSNAQANVIESIKVNGTAQTITSKSVNITVPTDNASLTNGAGYLVASDIANKADKSTTLAGYGITNAYTKTEVDAKTVVDSALSSSSTNPVQNKVVNSAISSLTSTVSANTSSISSHTTAITNLQTAIDEIQEITSAEISALFA